MAKLECELRRLGKLLLILQSPSLSALCSTFLNTVPYGLPHNRKSKNNNINTWQCWLFHLFSAEPSAECFPQVYFSLHSPWKRCCSYY